ncbi:MAG: hypothetical protein QOE11_1712 [Solirubrobacteraceae bacterium]|jgi:hypothetical protein|nr:hypothetical protein [Solirubrobacteraceae bacterium]
MLRQRSCRLLVFAVACLAAAPASSAIAAKRSPARPVVSSVGPVQVGVGQVLTIRGRNFLAGTGRDTVVFKRAGSPAVSVKAVRSTMTRLTVVVPAALAQYLPFSGGVAQPARFRVRVRARAISSRYTALKRSALIGPTAGPATAAPAGCPADDGSDAADVADLSSSPLDDLPDGCSGTAADAPDLATTDDSSDDGTDDGAAPGSGGPPDPWDLLGVNG